MMKFDEDELAVLDALENDLIDAVTPTAEEIYEIQTMAKNTLRKDCRVTIRLYDHDLRGIQKKSIE